MQHVSPEARRVLSSLLLPDCLPLAALEPAGFAAGSSAHCDPLRGCCSDRRVRFVRHDRGCWPQAQERTARTRTRASSG